MHECSLFLLLLFEHLIRIVPLDEVDDMFMRLARPLEFYQARVVLALGRHHSLVHLPGRDFMTELTL